MNEKEKKAIEYLEGMLNMYNNRPAPISQKALKILVNLIEKQQKEIEGKKALIDNYMHNEKVYQDLLENSISKDKIREMLEKYKDKEMELTDEQGYWGDNTLQVKTETLQELLEED